MSPSRVALILALAVVATTSSALALPPREIYLDIRHAYPGESSGGPATVHIMGAEPISNPWSVKAVTTAIPGLTTSDFSSIISPFAPKTKPKAGAATNCDYTVTVLDKNSGPPCVADVEVSVRNYYNLAFLLGRHIVGLGNRSTNILSDFDPLGVSLG